MLAVIKSGGKQYTVTEKSVLKLEKLVGEPGTQIEFEEVLMLSDGPKDIVIGSPFVKGAKVTAEIINQTRDSKIIVFKKKRRHNYRRKNGHRQSVTYVRINNINKASA